MAKVAFLGLGVMGYPMARHLKAKGHEVTVYNRTTAKAEERDLRHRCETFQVSLSELERVLGARGNRVKPGWPAPGPDRVSTT